MFVCFINVDSCRVQSRDIGNKLELGMNCLLDYWSCEENSSPLEEQEILLTTKISLDYSLDFKKKVTKNTVMYE